MEKTFAQKVKSELCEPRVERKCCAVAEAYGVLLFCRSFSPREILSEPPLVSNYKNGEFAITSPLFPKNPPIRQP